MYAQRIMRIVCVDRYLFMNKKLIFILLAGMVLTACSRDTRSEADYPQKDSIIEVVTQCLVASETDRAMAVIDSAETAGVISPFSAEVTRAHVWAADEATIANVQTHCAPLLEQDLTLDEQAEVLGILVYAARLRRDDAHLLEYGSQYIEVCQQTGETVKILSMRADIGAVLIRLGRIDEGLEEITDAIAQSDGIRQYAVLDAGILAKKAMIRALLDLKRYEEVIPFCERIITSLQDYEAHPEVYADGSDRLPTDERRPGYIDFYIGQAYAFMAYAYASFGQYDNARTALRLFEQTNYSRTFAGKKLISSTRFM